MSLPIHTRLYSVALCLSLLLAASFAFAQPPPAANPFRSGIFSYVADSRGKLIGRVVNASEFASGSAAVDMVHGQTGMHYTIFFTRDYIFAEAGDVLYDAPDCQGQAIIIWNPYDAAMALYKPAAVGPGRSIWIPTNFQPIDTWPMSRYLPPGITCANNDPYQCTETRPEGCQNVDWVEPDEPHTPVIGLVKVGALNDHYQPPYRMGR